jgi:DNA-binding transcriptional MocR family regulator
VLYVPGEYCLQPDETGHVPRRHMRLSFGAVAPEQIEPGIERLAAVVDGLLSASPPRRRMDNAPAPCAP